MKAPSFKPITDPIRGDQELIRKASELIKHAFLWQDTPEDAVFWASVSRRLAEIADHAVKEDDR